MLHFPKSIIVAGTGKNVGKTSFVRTLIKKFRKLHPVGVKITPHFHSGDPGILLFESTNFVISKENKNFTGKDTANFLLDGASEVFFIQVKDEFLSEAFNKFCEIVDINRLIIYESASLINFVKPGLFFVITDNSGQNKNLHLGEKADLLVINDKKDVDFKIDKLEKLIENFLRDL